MSRITQPGGARFGYPWSILKVSQNKITEKARHKNNVRFSLCLRALYNVLEETSGTKLLQFDWPPHSVGAAETLQILAIVGTVYHLVIYRVFHDFRA